MPYCECIWEGRYLVYAHYEGLVPRLVANITRCFFWLGDRFEFALLFQSLFMIVAQVRDGFMLRQMHILTYMLLAGIIVYLPEIPPDLEP